MRDRDRRRKRPMIRSHRIECCDVLGFARASLRERVDSSWLRERGTGLQHAHVVADAQHDGGVLRARHE